MKKATGIIVLAILAVGLFTTQLSDLNSCGDCEESPMEEREGISCGDCEESPMEEREGIS